MLKRSREAPLPLAAACSYHLKWSSQAVLVLTSCQTGHPASLCEGRQFASSCKTQGVERGGGGCSNPKPTLWSLDNSLWTKGSSHVGGTDWSSAQNLMTVSQADFKIMQNQASILPLCTRLPHSHCVSSGCDVVSSSLGRL